MRKYKLTFNEALKFVKEKRSIVGPNLGFQEQLTNYELELKKF
jgi:hypothetical protein